MVLTLSRRSGPEPDAFPPVVVIHKEARAMSENILQLGVTRRKFSRSVLPPRH